jgi:putative tryptophan/tyrosine transport system substrate-binding protein
MRRREFITLLGGAAAWPVTASAQRVGTVPKIGVLSVGTIASSGHLVDAFVQGLRARGYIENDTIVIERRYAQGDLNRLEPLAAELVRLNVDILFAPTSSAVLAAAKATVSIPIIFALVTDPVGERFVASRRRPGGTIMGMTSIAVDLAAKRLEILLELVRRTSRFGILYYSAHPGVPLQLDELQRAANVLGKSYLAVQAGRLDDLPMAFETIVRWGADAAAVIENPFYFANRDRIVALAASNRIPTIYNSREYAKSGGLVSYGANYSDLYGRAAGYVDKILKGALPADMPVEQPIKFELVMNLKAAKAIDVTIPEALLFRADEVIE